MAVAALTMCACSGSEENGNGTTEKKDSVVSKIKNGDAYLYADNDTTETWLGSGYDVTDAYLKGKREQIIDLSAVEEGRMSNAAYPSCFDKSIVGYGSAKEVLRDLTDKCEIEVPDKSALLFTGTLSECPFIASASDYSGDFQFIFTIMQWEAANLARLNLSKTHKNKYDDYLTDDFKKAIQEESADKVVERFGTHVLTEVVVGRCVTTLYSSRNNDSKTLYEGMLNRYSATVDGNNNYAVDNNNPDGRLLVWLNGGNMSRLPLDWNNGSARIKGASKQKLNFSDWTLNTNNGTLIEIDGEKMIPIYDLVNDDKVRSELFAAVQKRIAQRQLK